MSPARQHRERHAAQTAVATPFDTVDSTDEGGQPAPAAILLSDEPLTPARAHKLRFAASSAIAQPVGDDNGDDDGTADFRMPRAASPAEAQMQARLRYDLRRLKDIKSIDGKIAAKREMLPAYRDWCDGLLGAAADSGEAVQEEVLPTMMIWAIDTGDYPRAIALAEHVLQHKLALPSRYDRDAPTLLAEEIAEAALKPGLENGFPLEILDRVDELVEGIDMHDQVRAKLNKALGLELQRLADVDPDAADNARTRTRALAALREAQRLDERIGVKGRINALEKLAGASAPAPNLDAWIDATAAGAADSAVALHAALTKLAEQNSSGAAG